MTTTLAIAGLWLLVCKIAIGLLWYANRQLKRTNVALAGQLIQAGGDFTLLQEQAGNVVAFHADEARKYREACGRQQVALMEIATTIGRRPPRRRWLARARKVAQLAAPVQLV